MQSVNKLCAGTEVFFYLCVMMALFGGELDNFSFFKSLKSAFLSFSQM